MWLRLNGPWVRIWLQELGGAYGGPSGIFIWICLVFFFLILGDVAFPRCRNSLSQHPSSPAKTLLLYHLPLIKHRDPGCPPHVLFSSSFLHSQKLAPSSTAWDGHCHQDFSSFYCVHSDQKGCCPPHMVRRIRNPRTQGVFPSAFGSGVICRSERNLVLVPLLSMFSIWNPLKKHLNI